MGLSRTRVKVVVWLSSIEGIDEDVSDDGCTTRGELSMVVRNSALWAKELVRYLTKRKERQNAMAPCGEAGMLAEHCAYSLCDHPYSHSFVTFNKIYGCCILIAVTISLLGYKEENEEKPKKPKERNETGRDDY
jgi:hypothetical protein